MQICIDMQMLQRDAIRIYLGTVSENSNFFLRVGESCVTSLSKIYNFGQGCEWNQELGIGEEEFKMRNNLLQSHKFSL